MDYQKEYLHKNPDYHKGDAGRKFEDISQIYISRPTKVLDLGCGVGRLSSMLYDKYLPNYMEAADLSKAAIQEAKKKEIKDIRFKAIDVFKYQPTRYFDTIFIADLIEHVQNDTALLKRIKGWSSETVIRVPLERNLTNDLFKSLKLSDEYQSAFKRFGHLRHYNFKSLFSLFEDNGYKIKKFKIYPLAKRSKFYFEFIRWISLLLYPVSPLIASNLFGGFAVFVLDNKNARKK